MIDIALLGYGVVGSGVAELISKNTELIEKKLKTAVNIKYILDLRDFPNDKFEKLIVHDFNIILNDPDIKVVAEMMGGSHPAYEFTKALLESGKSVVTSNKECVAKFGHELMLTAQKHSCRYLFEASVGGGIPLIRPMTEDLAQVNIKSVSGILNGTTNYILTKMLNDEVPFENALNDAKAKGYAEHDPTADIEGIDAARKLAILAAVSYGISADPDKIFREGITKITADDISVAEKFNCSIKLIGKCEADGGKIFLTVCPRFVPMSNPLAAIDDVFNGVLIDTEMLGEVMFYGKGAGKLPTASAVVSDIINIAIAPQRPLLQEWTLADNGVLGNINDYRCSRILVFDADKSSLPYFEEKFGRITYFFEKNNKLYFEADDMSESEINAMSSSCKPSFISQFRML